MRKTFDFEYNPALEDNEGIMVRPPALCFQVRAHEPNPRPFRLP